MAAKIEADSGAVKFDRVDKSPDPFHSFPSYIFTNGRLDTAAMKPIARCGYDDAGNRVSDVSVGGECRGRAGTRCVQRRSGRAEWMCADAVDELYADHDYFTACTVVHEFLHPFGIDPDANFDHYGTAPCRSRTSMSAADAADLRKAQLSCGLCPDVFARFRKGT